jgi:hypothetical protein
MDSQLLLLSNLLVSIALWVGVPFSLIGMLLSLGFKSKHSLSSTIAIIGIAGLSLFTLGMSVEGLVTGEAPSISRHWGVVNKLQTPTGYWTAMAFWFLLSLTILGCCFWQLRRVVKTLTGHSKGTPNGAP